MSVGGGWNSHVEAGHPWRSFEASSLQVGNWKGIKKIFLTSGWVGDNLLIWHIFFRERIIKCQSFTLALSIINLEGGSINNHFLRLLKEFRLFNIWTFMFFFKKLQVVCYKRVHISGRQQLKLCSPEEKGLMGRYLKNFKIAFSTFHRGFSHLFNQTWKGLLKPTCAWRIVGDKCQHSARGKEVMV